MKTFVVIPTYNEKHDIEQLIKEILLLNIEGLSVLVVDDNSPDGTYAIVDRISRKDPRVHLLHRIKRKGRGSAGIDGFRYALDKGADYIIEMDGDFSHNPRHIPQLLEKARISDVVVGSRFVRGGADKDRGLRRQFCTKLAGIYVRALLKVHINDVSSGFRCFRREVLERIDLDDMISTGPSIVLEILYKTLLKGFTITETPIIFTDRRQGQTKLDYLTLLETLVMVLRLRQLKSKGLI
jgi:dolichol-phosphate mannosyltransferase